MTNQDAERLRAVDANELTQYLNLHLEQAHQVLRAVTNFRKRGKLTPDLEERLAKASMKLLSSSEITMPGNLGRVLGVLQQVSGWEPDAALVYEGILVTSAESYYPQLYPSEIAARTGGLVGKVAVPPYCAILLLQQAENHLDDLVLAGAAEGQLTVKAAIASLEPFSRRAREADRNEARAKLDFLIGRASDEWDYHAAGRLARIYGSQFGFPNDNLIDSMENSRRWLMSAGYLTSNFAYLNVAYHLAVAVKHRPEAVPLQPFEDALKQASALTAESSLSEEDRSRALEQLAFQFGFFERAALQTTKTMPQYGITQEIQARASEALREVTDGWRRHSLGGRDESNKSITPLLYIASLVGYWHRVHGTVPLRTLQPESVQQLRTALRHGYDLLPNLSILRRASARESLDTLHMEFNIV